jgi:hypothetical protein
MFTLKLAVVLCENLGLRSFVVWQIFTNISGDTLPPSSGHNTHFKGHTLAGSFGIKSCLWYTFYPPSILIFFSLNFVADLSF